MFQTITGKTIKVTGQATGQAINFVFKLGNDQFIYGVGTLEQDIHVCKAAGEACSRDPKRAMRAIG